jgi:hypothetical protein
VNVKDRSGLVCQSSACVTEHASLILFNHALLARLNLLWLFFLHHFTRILIRCIARASILKSTTTIFLNNRPHCDLHPSSLPLFVLTSLHSTNTVKARPHTSSCLSFSLSPRPFFHNIGTEKHRKLSLSFRLEAVDDTNYRRYGK